MFSDLVRAHKGFICKLGTHEGGVLLLAFLGHAKSLLGVQPVYSDDTKSFWDPNFYLGNHFLAASLRAHPPEKIFRGL